MSNMPTLRDILNGDPGDATDVEWNFQTIETHIDNELINADGSVAMAAALNLVAGAPTLAAHATRKDYVDGLDAAQAATTAALVDSLTVFSRTTDKSYSSGESYDVVWETETSDPDGWGSTGSATLTSPATGLYQVMVLYSGNLGSGAGGGEEAPGIDLRLTGTIASLTMSSTGTMGSGQVTASSFSSSFSFVIYAPVGQTLKLSSTGGTYSGGTAPVLTQTTINIARLR